MSRSALVAWPIGSDDDTEWSIDQATPAHKNRRRRKYTQELVRCPFTSIVSKRILPCNALVWARPQEMADHLHSHYLDREFTEQEVRDYFTVAKAQYLPDVHTCTHLDCPCDKESEKNS
jgi:hypothetical protein